MNDSLLESSCIVRAIVSGIAGMSWNVGRRTRFLRSVGLGVGMGVFLGTLEGAHGEMIGQNSAEQLRHMFRRTLAVSWQRSRVLGSNFGSITLVYAGCECMIEKTRGKHDMFNTASAGAVAGALFGVLGVQHLPFSRIMRRASLSSAGFAAFGIAMEIGTDWWKRRGKGTVPQSY